MNTPFSLEHRRCPLALACALALTLLVGCSSGDDDVDPAPGETATDTGSPISDGLPFGEPDATGTSVVSRLGYRGALDKAESLVSADYLDLLFEVESDLIGLLEPDEFFATEYENRNASCTGGGSAVLSSGASRFDPISIVLDDCVFQGRTLDGGYARSFGTVVFGSGFRGTVEASMDDLLLDAGDAGSVRVTGTTTRSDGEAGFCADLPKDFNEYQGRVASAVVVDEEGRTFTIGDARFSEKLNGEALDSDQNEAAQVRCTGSVERLSFDAAATVQGTPFGTDSATLTRTGDIVRDPRQNGESSATASTSATFGDGSSVVATLTDDAAGEAQIDISADGVATSFTAGHDFDAR